MESKPKIITELTLELADKIWNEVQKRMYDEKVSKDAVLHHLKQLKAQMGKEKKIAICNIQRDAIDVCMKIIDKKIDKINK